MTLVDLTAARRIPLSMVGFLQYIAPTLQFLLGVVVYQEPFPVERLVGFSIIWAALAVYTLEGVLLKEYIVLDGRTVAELALESFYQPFTDWCHGHGMLARIQALIRRHTDAAEPTRLAFEDLSINLITREVFRGETKIELQPLEFALLEYLLRNAGRVVSKTMIMENVWDYNFDPQTNVVESRIYKLREKIDKDFPVKLIHTVRGVGYALRAPV